MQHLHTANSKSCILANLSNCSVILVLHSASHPASE